MSFTLWDLSLLISISVSAVLVAYLRHPRWKALILSIPVPFTFAFLSVGRPIDATNVAAMLVLLFYTHAVRFLRYSLKLPIVLSIMIAAALYVLIGSAVAASLPKTDLVFWAMAALAAAAALVVRRLEPDHEELGHRSPLPLAVKIPLIVLLVGCLLLIKQYLKGFMTMFPMVGVFASYEARNSLWTNCRQIPVLIATMLPMVITVKLTQDLLGRGWSLALGWAVFLCAMIPVFRSIILKTRQRAVA